MIPLTQEDMQSLSTIERGDNTRTDDQMEVDEGFDIAFARSIQDQEVTLETSSVQESERPTPRSRVLPSAPLTATHSTSESTSSERTLSSGYTLSSPENTYTMPGGHPLDDSPLFSTETPPPNYASAVKQGQAKPLCIVCGQRDAYNDGNKAFPTCGNNCARKLKSMQGLDTRSSGHPYSSTYDRGFSSGSTSNRYGFRPRSPPIKMCTVCKIRPRYEKGGKSYDTCGLTCAAKLGPAKSADKCEFCKVKPKGYVNYKEVPYCSLVCRDKAKALATAVANSSTCTTCLICWKATKAGDKDDLCSPSCHTILQANAPKLLEIPKGHVSFKKVSDHYFSSWKDTKYPCPQIKRIYMVELSDATRASQIAYQSHIEQSRTFMRSKKSNTKYLWLGVARDCLLGDTGSTVPCAIPTCFLCSLIRTEIHPQVFAKGIICTGLLEWAIARSSKMREKASSKLVLLASVALGQEAELAIDEDLSLPAGSHSIRLLQRRGTLMSNKISHHEESIVLAVEAVRPLYIISFESE